MRRPIALPLIAVTLLAGCSATASPSTSTAPSASPRSGPSAMPSSSPTQSPSPTIAPSPTAQPSPSLPVVGQAPTGPWTSIRWIDTGSLPLGPTEVGVYGWSGGYVALEQSSGYDSEGSTEVPVVIRASSSTDGVHWTAPVTLETGFKGGFRIESIVEGPNGLLALGYPYGDTCGGPEPLRFLWASTDGRTWDRLPMPKVFGSAAVQTISGGAAGYIAFGTKSDGTTQAIWTSADARAWTARKLPTVSRGTLALDAAVSFDHGFILAGAVLGEEGCGGAAHIKPAIWSSADGGSWTRASLPGASTDPNASLRVRASGDHVVVVQLPPGDAATAPAWSSNDGVSWTSLGTVRVDAVWGAFSDAHHSIVSILPDSGVGLPTLTEVGETGTETELHQDGGGPVESEDTAGYVYALGPTGVLAVRGDGEDSWLGLPS